MPNTPTNQAILEAMSREFMQPEITAKLSWYEIDGTRGITFVDVDTIGHVDLTSLWNEETETADYSRFTDYYEGEIQDIRVLVGFGPSLSTRLSRLHRLVRVRHAGRS